MKIRIAIVLIALFIMGIVMTVSGVSDLIKLNGNIPDFNYESMQNVKKGDFVQGYIWNIYGNYANETTTKTTMGIETSSNVSAEYFIMTLLSEDDLAKDLYITITAETKEEINMLFELYAASEEYYNGNEDAYFPEYGIVAEVRPLDSDLEQYFVDWFMYDPPLYSSAAEARNHIVPYELNIYKPSQAYVSLAIGIAIIAVFIIVGIVIYTKSKAQNVPQNFIPAAEPNFNNFTAEKTSSSNGFEETYTPPQPVPIPDIPQPTDADEFFARAPKAAAPIVEEPKEEQPIEKDKPQEQPAPVLGDMDALDTTGLLDDADYEYISNDDNEFIE
ncbi:MAG: hypothetical protein IJZ61_01465 [Oscillospiraceae bacterium]|nr:hypothetical protein [Oscillospiraceae bacterium]